MTAIKFRKQYIHYIGSDTSLNRDVETREARVSIDSLSCFANTTLSDSMSFSLGFSPALDFFHHFPRYGRQGGRQNEGGCLGCL